MSEERQRPHDVIRQDYDRKGFSEVLRSFRFYSAPQNRAAQHLLALDLHETYAFAHDNPEALRQVAA